jgi:hypothetical protein
MPLFIKELKIARSQVKNYMNKQNSYCVIKPKFIIILFEIVMK